MQQDKPVMTQMMVRGDGSRVALPFEGARFENSELLSGRKGGSLRFAKFNGWSILEALVPIMLFFRKGPIVEIGAGASTFRLVRIAEDYGVIVHSCDKSPRKAQNYGDNHKFYQVLSEDFMENYDDLVGEDPAIVLIDADHSYEAAKKEFDFFYKKLIPWGVIFLHDTMPPHEELIDQAACSDVYKLRQELEQNRNGYDIFTWPYTAGYCGLTMIIKRDEKAKEWEM